MKRFISMLLLLAILIGMTPYSLAEDSFSVKHRAIKIDEEYLDIDIVYPFFEEFAGSDKANQQIKYIIVDAIGDARRSASDIKDSELNAEEGSEVYLPTVTLMANYDCEKNGEVLSIKLNFDFYAGGAHPIGWINSIIVDIKAGEILEFEDLFKENSNYDKTISAKIIDEMNKDKDRFFEDYAKAVLDKKGKFDFYIDGNSIVVYFDAYDVAPYASGMPSFVFEAKDIKNILKDRVYESIKNAEKRGAIIYNGKSIKSKNEVLDRDISMIPLRDLAEALGYEVGWDKENGAVVAGGFIKDGVNSYGTKDKKPVKLIAPLVVKGVTYVPLEYFTEVLEENVSYGSMTNLKTNVRAYERTEAIVNLDDFMK